MQLFLSAAVRPVRFVWADPPYFPDSVNFRSRGNCGSPFKKAGNNFYCFLKSSTFARSTDAQAFRNRFVIVPGCLLTGWMITI